MKNILFYLFLFQLFISFSAKGQIQFSISYGQIVEKKNGIETFSNVWEFATIDMVVSNNNSKFNVTRYEKVLDSINLKNTLNLEQVEKWNYISEKGVNWCLAKNPTENKYYIAVYTFYLNNTSEFLITEFDLQKQEMSKNSISFRNSASNEKDMLSFLSGDGMSVYRYDVSNGNSFNLNNSINLARKSVSDNVKLSFTSDQVLLKDETDFLKIVFPPDYNHSYLMHRDISRNTMFKDGVYTFKNDSIVTSDGNYGIVGGKNGFDKFTYSWFVPDNIEIISYKCNRPGKWKKDYNAATFYGDKGINNVLFEISYKIKNVAAKEIEKTSIALKEKISIPNKKTKVSIWDNNVEDGDIISLSLNGEWIVRNLEVKKCRTSFYLNLDPGENFLVMKAENTGSTPPNTAAFFIETDGFSKEIILNSDMGKSEMIQIDVK
jgi:hypothetical protein